MRVSQFSIILVHFLIIFGDLCNGDTNSETGFNCPDDQDSAAEDPTFQANLRSLLGSLVANAPLRRGFYKAERAAAVYGLVQCRGDVSAGDCASCAEDSVRVALEKCRRSRDVAVWFRWCFLRYSDENFIGAMDRTSISRTNDTDFDDLSAVPRGLELVTRLTLSVPKQALMFETAAVDVAGTAGGGGGKRYAMGQCNRDIGREECGKCLQSQVADFKTTIWNKRGWEVYGMSCSMWYHDYRFFFNVSTESSPGVIWRRGVRVQFMTAFLALVMVV